MADCRSRDCTFESQLHHITFVEIVHEIISMVIFVFPLIQEEQLSITRKNVHIILVIYQPLRGLGLPRKSMKLTSLTWSKQLWLNHTVPNQTQFLKVWMTTTCFISINALWIFVFVLLTKFIPSQLFATLTKFWVCWLWCQRVYYHNRKAFTCPYMKAWAVI